jgi:hypothetical protein
VIIDALVETIFGLVSTLLGLIPFPSIDLGSLAPAFGAMRAFDALVPIHEGLSAFLVVLSVLGAMFVYRVVKVVLAFVPWVGGSGA